MCILTDYLDLSGRLVHGLRPPCHHSRRIRAGADEISPNNMERGSLDGDHASRSVIRHLHEKTPGADGW